MISLAVMISILLLVLWGWLAYEYSIAIPLSVEEEFSLEEELSSQAGKITIQEAN